jgi:hypothetical protein
MMGHARPPAKDHVADMRDTGVHGLLIYCSDHACSHLITMSGDRWPDEMRLSDLEPANRHRTTPAF